MQFPRDLKASVAFVTVNQNMHYVPVGTAFFLSVDIDDFAFIYLITCKHVVKQYLDSGVPLYLRMNRSDKQEVVNDLLLDEWVFHDDDAVDLAVMPWVKMRETPRPRLMGIPSLNYFGLSKDVLEETKYDFSEGDEVVFVGLFAPYTGETWNMPVVRFGRLALITDEKIAGGYGLTESILIECQAYPGNSGAPLYIAMPYRGNSQRLFLLGVISGFFPQEIMINNKRAYAHTGISLATPIVKLVEILAKKELMEARERKTGAMSITSSPAQPASIVLDNTQTVTQLQLDNLLPPEGYITERGNSEEG